MSKDRLTEFYGPSWTTDPPPDAKTLIIEGSIEITELTPGRPNIVLQWEKEDNTIAVLQKLEPYGFDVLESETFVELNPAALLGQITYYIIESERIKDLQGMQYPDNSGYHNAPADGTNQPQTGLSLLLPVSMRYSPIVITEGKGFDLVVEIQNLEAGFPIPYLAKRYFSARIQGFTLYTY
jgi:hypothetical protein